MKYFLNQEAYDNAAPQDDEWDEDASKFEDEVDYQERIIRADTEASIQALLSFIAHADELGEDVYGALYAIVDPVICGPWDDRWKPTNILVNAATRWMAECNARKVS